MKIENAFIDADNDSCVSDLNSKDSFNEYIVFNDKFEIIKLSRYDFVEIIKF